MPRARAAAYARMARLFYDSGAGAALTAISELLQAYAVAGTLRLDDLGEASDLFFSRMKGGGSPAHLLACRLGLCWHCSRCHARVPNDRVRWCPIRGALFEARRRGALMQRSRRDVG